MRRRIINEPRGHTDMYGAVLTPAHDDADLDVFFLNGQGYSPMCGHAIIAIAKVVLETQAVPAVGKTATSVSSTEVELNVRMNTPAGRVTATALYVEAEKRVRRVRFENVPSFVTHLDQSVDVPGLGRIKFDISFGGAFYAIVDASQLEHPALDGANYTGLVSDAARIKRAILDTITIRHPYERDLDGLFGVIFTGPPLDESNHSRNVNVFEDGIVDRCPTGTGVSARAALHYARSELPPSQEITIESIIGTKMSVRVKSTAEVLDDQGSKIPAVVPEVGSDAFVMGYSTFLFDPGDPLVDGLGVFK